MRARRAVRLPPLLALLVAGLLSGAAAVQAASGLPATITIHPADAGPGSPVQVAGLDFPAGQVVRLQLTTTAGAILLGTTVVEEGGYFRESVTLPEDVAPGFWEFRATADDGTVAVLMLEAGEAAPALPADERPAGMDAAAGSGPSGTDVVVLLVLVTLVATIGAGVAYAWQSSGRGGRQPGMGAGDDPIWSTATSDEPTWGTRVADEPTLGGAPGEP